MHPSQQYYPSIAQQYNAGTFSIFLAVGFTIAVEEGRNQEEEEEGGGS